MSTDPLYDGSSIFADIYDILDPAEFQLHELTTALRSRRGEWLQVDTLFIRP